ncbi:MAG: dienelactone hydrolase family protein, partial [Thiohalophilus sp.]
MNKKTVIITGLLLLMTTTATAAIKTKNVTYKDQSGTEMKGYFAYDDSIKGKRPGVLVVHEWWGQNDYARKRARMLAKQGYVAFALDMYGQGKTASHPEDAGKFSSEVKKNMPEAEARFRAALQQLKQHPLTNPD